MGRCSIKYRSKNSPTKGKRTRDASRSSVLLLSRVPERSKKGKYKSRGGIIKGKIVVSFPKLEDMSLQMEKVTSRTQRQML